MRRLTTEKKKRVEVSRGEGRKREERGIAGDLARQLSDCGLISAGRLDLDEVEGHPLPSSLLSSSFL